MAHEAPLIRWPRSLLQVHVKICKPIEKWMWSVKKENNYWWMSWKDRNRRSKKVRCTICLWQQDVVKIHRISDQIRAICTDKGEEIRQTYMDEHLKSTLHAEAVKANRLQSLTVKQLVDNKATINSSISNIHVYVYSRRVWSNGSCCFVD